jgi:hypothetical protein
MDAAASMGPPGSASPTRGQAWNKSDDDGCVEEGAIICGVREIGRVSIEA